MTFTLDDLYSPSGSFACNAPSWTDEQIQLAKNLIALETLEAVEFQNSLEKEKLTI